MTSAFFSGEILSKEKKCLSPAKISPRGHWHTVSPMLLTSRSMYVEMRYKPESKVLVFVTRKMIKEWCERQVPRKVLGDSHLKNLDIQCLSPAKKYKLYKSSINKSLHFAQRRLSSSTRGQSVTAQLNLSREWKNRMTTVVIRRHLVPVPGKKV